MYCTNDAGQVHKSKCLGVILVVNKAYPIKTSPLWTRLEGGISTKPSHPQEIHLPRQFHGSIITQVNHIRVKDAYDSGIPKGVRV